MSKRTRKAPKGPKKLAPKRQRFVEEYIIDLNGTQAAIRAGYSERSAASIAEELLRFPEVQAAVQAAMQERSKRTQITADRVLEELARVAFSNMKDFASWSDNAVILHHSDNLSEDAARCVSEVSQTITKDGGSIRFKLHDKVAALEKLGRHLKLFTEKHEHEHSGPGGGPVPVINILASGGSPPKL